ncbi:MBL fold metallo-hydrolase [Bacillus sp. RAR_GA_16]|uniref:MBL fold metallo-hydrolase n=1 Tax=Bacillus sp. RAR_GA_16 TaxID=2876774 RepID=UPI001CCF34D8|nr:MBL fold metallo-hydrolase [Bacillus sp. RAR_GA_16]MCA0172507.1 MBL fold metallo-hydrolase [Bacillus sp. RAR_GA_16]
MKIEFLGTGGAMAIPRPLCQCAVCIEARKKGVPYSRSGPSVFVHGPNVLIDTPEDSYMQLNRSQISTIDGVFYSHWHPDHVMGRRVLESVNADWSNHPPKGTTTDVYLPEQVAIDFQSRLGTGEHLAFFESQEYIALHMLKDGQNVTIHDVTITPFRLSEDYVYAFLFEGEGKRVLIAPDELYGWEPPNLGELDVAILPTGICEFHPLTGERQISADHPVLKEEATFRQTLAIIEKLQVKEVYLTHLEEPDQLSFDDLKKVEETLSHDKKISFAFDTLMIHV